MFRKILSILLLVCHFLFLLSVKTEKIRVTAPFRMPVLNVPDFSDCPDFVITDFGAAQNNQSANSKAIAEAINAAYKAGGGVL
jgi:hypothetical protein